MISLSKIAACLGLLTLTVAATPPPSFDQTGGATPNGFSDYGEIFAPARLGIGEPIVENASPVHNQDGSIRHYAWDIDQQVDAILRLRPAIVRVWISTGLLFAEDGSPKFDLKDNTTSDPNVRKLFHAVRRFKAAKIPVLGIDHSFPHWMTGIPARLCGTDDLNWNALPARDLTAGSAYMQFLERYRSTWTQIARLLPEIQSWEPANETNGGLTVLPPQDQLSCPLATGTGRTGYDYDTRVLVTLDLMARAKQGISAGNRAAVVFMPPPGPVTPQDGVMPARDLTGIRDFIQALYDGVFAGLSVTGSTNPRDYFDGAGWHPYIFQDATQDTWVAQNNMVHDVLVQAGDAGIPVIFSEVGNSDLNWSHATQKLEAVSPLVLRDWMHNTVALSREHLPWLNYLIWFRAIDSPRSADWGGEHQRRFGILNEWSAADPSTPYQPKPSAHVFCAFTNCTHREAQDGPFRAVVKGEAWREFRLTGTTYCELPSRSSPRDRRPRPERPAPVRVLDVKDYAYSGPCG